MSDYNDGEWHIWNGGECPVHPKSIVQIHLADETRLKVEKDAVNFHKYADDYFWAHASPIGANDIVAFRVVKEYREPREFWVTIYDGMAWDTSAQAEQHNANLPDGGSQIIHVREVLA